MSKSIANRHQYILLKLKEQGFVNVNELSEALNVSLVTIRKDLRLLESRNLLHRTHGSASLNQPYIWDRNISDKEQLAADEKHRIAKAACRFVEPNDSIILASGSTILEMARQLSGVKPLTLVTSSLNVAQLVNISLDIEVYQLGGIMRKSSNSVVGPIAERMLEGFSCNKLFIGADGVDPNYGITTTSALEASLNQAMMKASQKVFLLADSTKFGRRGFGRICNTNQIDVVVTDSGLPDSIKRKIESLGVEVVIG